MITLDNLGINLGFANNRFPEPGIWTHLVGSDLNLRKVQFVADILNPMLRQYNASYFYEQIDKTIECLKKYNIQVTSMMTSSFTRVNHFSHPDKSYRDSWFSWFVDFLEMGTSFGAKMLGSHFGIMTTDSLKQKDIVYKETLKYWSELSAVAKDLNYQCLFFEPMSIEREFGNTIENTERILNDINEISHIPFKLCLDVGHAPHPSQRDYRVWLRKFAKDCCIVHLQQSELNSSNHSPFTKAYNETGIVHPNDVINILNEFGAEPELDFEISFREKEEVEPTIIHDLKESVEYWKQSIK